MHNVILMQIGKLDVPVVDRWASNCINPHLRGDLCSKPVGCSRKSYEDKEPRYPQQSQIGHRFNRRILTLPVFVSSHLPSLLMSYQSVSFAFERFP